jgi:hypothetical protein
VGNGGVAATRLRTPGNDERRIAEFTPPQQDGSRGFHTAKVAYSPNGGVFVSIAGLDFAIADHAGHDE